ncbi:tetratricopeptide repeat protein [Stratiformator vulcanicus]|uniref:Lipoprotein NlpI n=1 Tax=Stratiformator vulcanicus TaxID=2527980 RepID=A0A517R4S4_9PLAN|nr:tetratricopeptide repeat protein [Stratiformator vulcanicus]QDT38877.1 Lipoprotein NlpI precursor [Stratiformator vulcanicus]
MCNVSACARSCCLHAAALAAISFGLLETQYAFAQTRNAPPAAENPNRDAEQAYQRGEFDRVVELTDSRLRRQPKDDVAYYLRGSAKIEQGLRSGEADSVREGIADAREAIRLRGRELVIYYLPYLYGMTNLSIIEERDDHAEVAVQIAEQTVGRAGIKPEEKANLLYQKGLALSYLKKQDEAVAAFDEAIRLNPKMLAAFTALADLYARSEQPVKAKAAFDRAVRSFPDNPLVYNNRGMFLQQQDELDAAVADFTRALELDRNFFYAYTNRGYTLLKQNQVSAAEADFNSSLKLNSRQPMVYGFRGTAYLAQGEFQKSIDDHRRAVSMVSKSAVAHADLGFAYFFAGDFKRAIESFDTARELEPGFKHLLPWKIEALRALGQQPEPTGSDFAESLAQSPDQRDWVDSLINFEFGRISSEELLAAVGGDAKTNPPQSAEAHYFIGRKLLRDGQTAAAKAEFQKTLSTNQQHLSAYRGAKFALQ